jgi:fibrillarin-like pre-rRNA processing protein
MSKIKQHQHFEDVFWIKDKLCTKNLTPGEQVYGERLIKTNQGEFREWEARRSKPAAAVYKNLHHFPLKKGMKVLYLGAASGTTCSHFSDIVGKKGIIYGIEISDRVLRELIPIAKKRKNIIPLLLDARKPEEYSWIEQVDIVYADVALKDQSKILIRNAKLFLKPQGFGMIAIKSRSIDVTEKPQIIYKKERKILEKFFHVTDFVKLHPYEKDHGFFVLKRKD